MTSFANLKRNSGNLDKLAKAIEQLNSAETSNDKDNFWKPEVDKAGNGYAVLRLLPSPAVDGDDGLPWVKVFDHGFQGPGGWYIENSLTTLGQKDPVSEYNSQLWNSGIEANKEVARKQKRRLSYICNVYVVEDPKNPDNEGKVFLYKFGKKIFDKINEAMNPQFEDEKAVNPFDLWEGANFKLKIRNVEGYRNYDKSEFASPSALFDDDEKLEAVWKKEYSLKEFLDPSKFKSYDELKGRLDKVLGLDGSAPAPRTTVEQAKAAPVARKPVDTGITADSSDDDDMLYFSRLAAD
jgi:hypothetical protein